MAGFVWRSKVKKQLIIPKGLNMIQVTEECPCCEYKVIAQQIVIGKGASKEGHAEECVEKATDHPFRMYLTDYWGNKKGTPNSFWLLRDVGRSHWTDDGVYCSGITYAYGKIDCHGKLIGLPKWFQTSYRYDGHMMLLQGCLEDGTVRNECGAVGYIVDEFYKPTSTKAWYKDIITSESIENKTGVYIGEVNV